MTAALAAMVVTAWTPSAQAVRFHVQSRLIGDGYQLITSDDQVINRRRGHVYLGLNLYDLTGDESYQLNVHTLLRFDTLLSIDQDELDRMYDGFAQHQLALLHAYVEGRALAGIVDFKLGRFTHSDSLDYMMIDGLSLSFRINPAFIAIDLLAGLESKHDLNPLSGPGAGGPTYNQAELDGVRKLATDSSTDLATIAVGGGIRLINFSQVRLRFAYRRLMSGTDELAVDSEKIGGAFWVKPVDLVDIHFNWSYDFFVNDADKIQARVAFHPTDYLDIDLQYLRLLPVFDSDSIFNIFASRPLNDVNLRLRFHLDRDHRIYAGGYVRLFANHPYSQTADGTGRQAFTADESIEAYGVSAGWFKRFGWDGRIGADVVYEDGFGGTYVFVDIGGTYAPLPRQLEFDIRATMVYFKEDLIENLNAVSGGYQLGARYLIEDMAAFMLVAEHNFNRLQSSQFRLSFLIDFNYIL